MKMSNEKLFKAREFAELAGVTVRALHHYDRLRLLKPSRYTSAGYRLYSERDFARLEQIVALKFIGFPLKEIAKILKRDKVDLATALRRQREAIEEKRRRLELAIKAIQRAEYVVGVSDEPVWEAFAKIIEVINMQTNMDWSKKYYSEEAQREIEKRAATIPREVIEQAQRDWAGLIKEVEAAVAAGEDPASERSGRLAARWSELVKGFTGGNPEIQKGLNQMYADRNNWPQSMPRPFGDEVQEFIVKAMRQRRVD
ncbi:MAG TPA: MerR family transcriptional regulator [Pyrinomonadaceae bacterium]|nr:MerR family transcriptional regulator [Pyrinomonadaceae bacterium]